MRSAVLERKTSETQIKLSLDIDGSGTSEISSGIGFLDHMLTLFAKHSGFNLEVSCTGDTYVDDHHSCEDIGIVLGSALREALGDKRGISRYGDIILTMDEALILCACDVSGRSCLVFDADFPTEKIGSFDTEHVQEFFEAFTRSSGITLHIRKLSGANSHHIAEGIFKAFARCLAKACGIDEKRKDEIPSTKGVI